METEPRNAGRANLWLFLIILLGLGLRASGLYLGQAYSYFGQGDGIAAYTVAVDYGRGEPRAQYIGQPNYNDHSKLPGPLWTVFCFLGLRSGGSIYGVIWGVILLNTALIYLTYLLAERTAGPKAALWAALFAATFPWVVYYSVGVYNPDVMGFLGALLFLALWRTATHERSRSIGWVGPLLLALPQFHMSGLMLIPTVVIVLWLSPARLNVPWLIGGVLGGLALYLPYISGEMANGWQNTHGMLSGKGGYSWDGLKALSVPLGFLSNWAPRWTRTMAEHRLMGAACCGWYPFLLLLNLVSAVLAAFLVAGVFLILKTSLKGLWRAPRRVFGRAPGTAFLAAVTLIPLAFALVSGKPFHSRYCLVLLAPLLSLAGAAAASWLQPVGSAGVRGGVEALVSARPVLRRVFLGALVVTIAANIWLVPAMYRFVGKRIENAEIFVPSWRKLESVYTALRRHAGAPGAVEVDDTAYLGALPREDKLRRDAALIRRYVAIRERERALASGQVAQPVTYFLKSAAETRDGDAKVAYRGHGIALIASPGS